VCSQQEEWMYGPPPQNHMSLSHVFACLDHTSSLPSPDSLEGALLGTHVTAITNLIKEEKFLINLSM
jgi:hypothetical protein